MSQIFYILFGWFLGLIGPGILYFFRSRARTREIESALRVELEDLQYRLAISSFQLALSHGSLTREFIQWLKPIVDKYSGQEPAIGIQQMVGKLAIADEQDLNEYTNQARAKEGLGSVLFTFQTAFLESHLADISKLPASLQRKVHEFRNQFAILNQQILKSEKYFEMTFNPSLGDENHRIIKQELKKKYNFIQDRAKIVAEKIELVLSEM